MSREDGFQTADISAAFFDDPKVRRLWRASESSPEVCECLTAYLATVLASWGCGRRLSVVEATPVWLAVTPEMLALLRGSGLIDKTGKVPAKSWDGWHSPAVARREARRSAGRSGGLAKAERSHSKGRATLYPSVPSIPSIPSVPSVPSVPEDAHDPYDVGEADVITWLARHGCALQPHSGYYRHVVVMVEHHGSDAVVGMLERLASAGTKTGDVKGYVFGARDALDAQTRPNLAEIGKADRDEATERSHQARLDRTQRELQALREVGS